MFNAEGFPSHEKITKDPLGQPKKSEMLIQKRIEKAEETEPANPELSEKDIEHILELSPLYEEMDEDEKNEEREIIKLWLKEKNNGNA